jgi:hypothetical protein
MLERRCRQARARVRFAFLPDWKRTLATVNSGSNAVTSLQDRVIWSESEQGTDSVWALLNYRPFQGYEP